jgi:hypothetical protein
MMKKNDGGMAVGCCFMKPQEHVQSGFDDEVQGGSGMIWVRMLAYVTGTVDQELLLRNEYLAAENRILKAQIKGRLLLADAEKATLAEIGHRGRKALEELSAVATPDTLLAWYRKLIANKFDGSKFRKPRGRPRVDEETERLVVRMAKENPLTLRGLITYYVLFFHLESRRICLAGVTRHPDQEWSGAPQ